MADDIVSFELSILDLIKRFVERQQVVLEAFEALRPALVAAENSNPNERQLAAILTTYTDSPWRGQWRDWRYHFQGAGCRLINTKTSEIIEWEASDINSFDRYWFVNWLEWLWMFNPDDEGLRMLKDFYAFRPTRYDLYGIIFPMLRVLSLENYIHHNARNKNRYTLANEEAESNIA